MSRAEVEKIAKAIVKQLGAAGIGVTDEAKAVAIIDHVMEESMEVERRIEADALKLLKKHAGASGASIDHDRALRMIMEKLAQERKFVL